MDTGAPSPARQCAKGECREPRERSCLSYITLKVLAARPGARHARDQSRGSSAAAANILRDERDVRDVRNRGLEANSPRATSARGSATKAPVNVVAPRSHQLVRAMIDVRQQLTVPSGGSFEHVSLPLLEKRGLGALSRLPVSLRVVLEWVVRNLDGRRIQEKDVASNVPTAERTRSRWCCVSIHPSKSRTSRRVASCNTSWNSCSPNEPRREGNHDESQVVLRPLGRRAAEAPLELHDAQPGLGAHDLRLHRIALPQPLPVLA